MAPAAWMEVILGACLHLELNNKQPSAVCSRHRSPIILLLIDLTHFLFPFSRNCRYLPSQ